MGLTAGFVGACAALFGAPVDLLATLGLLVVGARCCPCEVWSCGCLSLPKPPKLSCLSEFQGSASSTHHSLQADASGNAERVANGLGGSCWALNLSEEAVPRGGWKGEACGKSSCRRGLRIRVSVGRASPGTNLWSLPRFKRAGCSVEKAQSIVCQCC